MKEYDRFIGRTISRYRILEKIGSGGAGIVFKAEDTRLKRMVAVKFLRPEWTLDPDARNRFILEAQTASALDHPNICTVYEIDETQDGRVFIAMAYYEGDTLKRRIESAFPAPRRFDSSNGVPPEADSRPLSMDQILDVAIQIAQGLESAHDAGIVHRDIKPANILITGKGDVKILAFGLAKLVGAMKNTVTGITLGTVEYLSPEQAQGFEVDRRSDIWSLGVTLYEMTTGRLPFHGDRPLTVIHSILHEKPDHFPSRRHDGSRELAGIVTCALSKNRADRYPSARLMKEDLSKLKGGFATKAGESRMLHSERLIGRLRRRNIRKNALISLLSILSLAVLSQIVIRLMPFLTGPSPPVRMTNITNLEGLEFNPVFSPDAESIAFSWNQPDTDRSDIYRRRIDGEHPIRLTYPPGSFTTCAWSPDGSTIAFTSEVKGQWAINTIPAGGGTVRRLLTLNPKWTVYTYLFPCGEWSPDGKHFVYNDMDTVQITSSIFIYSFESRESRRITFPPSNTSGDWLPKFSSDGKNIAFLRLSGATTGDLFVYPLKENRERRITSDNTSIWGLDWEGGRDEIIFSASRNKAVQIWKVSSNGGEPELLIPGLHRAGDISISRDGRKMALVEGGQNGKMWRYDIHGPGKQDVTFHSILDLSNHNSYGCFSPDGHWISFVSDYFGNNELWVSRQDGTDPRKLTDFKTTPVSSPRWSYDSRWIAFENNSNIFAVRPTGGPVKRITDSQCNEGIPSWSRDGKWIYFASRCSEIFQIAKRPFQGGQVVQITKDGGVNGFESSDSKWFYYNTHIPVDGIWRISLENGETQLVTDKDIALYAWFLAPEGIFFIRSTYNSPALEYLDFDSGRIERITELYQKGIFHLGVSPDRKSFLMSKHETSLDIVLVENF